jgi:hypothetical protein
MNNFMIRLPLSLFIVFPMMVVQTSWGDPAEAKTDLQAKIDHILAVRKPHDQLTQLSDLGTKLPLDEIPQALAASQNLKQWRQRAVLQQATLQHWAELAPAQAFAYLGKLPESRFKDQAVHFAALKFTAKDPEAAAAAADRLPPGQSRSDAINTVAGIWAQTDGRKALDWVESLPEGAVRDSAEKSALFVWVHIDPSASYPYIEKLPSDNIKNALITNVANEWALLDAPAALKWANNLPEGSEKELGIENSVESWADYDPRSASNYALQLAPGPVRQQTAAGVAERWATQDPQAAAEWIETKLDAPTQQMALPRLMNFWAMETPQEAGQWVANLPPGTFRESAIQSYVQSANNWAPDLAAKLAGTLTDPSLRQQKVNLSVKHWMEVDPTGARAWLQSQTAANLEISMPSASN